MKHTGVWFRRLFIAAILVLSSGACSDEEPKSSYKASCDECPSGTRCGSARDACRTICTTDEECPQCAFCDGEGLCASGPCRCDVPADCDDADPCNGVEVCTNNLCGAGTPVSCPASTNDCFDNLCQNVGGDAECQLIANGSCSCGVDADCDDGDACNGEETCVNLNCTPGTPVVYPPPAEPCKVDVCDTVGGSPVPVRVDADDGTPCEDDLFCTATGSCDAGFCVTPNDIDCSDGIDCTTDSCNETDNLCEHTPVDAECDDSIGCTIDTCVPCPAGGCNPALVGCQHTGDDDQCNDGLDCSIDTCVVGSGCTATPDHQYCDDNYGDTDPCTVATCSLAAPSPGSGCIDEFGNIGTGCDDDDSCTSDDECGANGCAGAPVPHLDPCTGGDLCWGTTDPVCMEFAVHTGTVTGASNFSLDDFRPAGIVKYGSTWRVLATATFDNNCAACPVTVLTLPSITNLAGDFSLPTIHAGNCTAGSAGNGRSWPGEATLAEAGWGFGWVMDPPTCNFAANLQLSSVDFDPDNAVNQTIVDLYDSIASASRVSGSASAVDMYVGGEVGGDVRVRRCSGTNASITCSGSSLITGVTGVAEGVAALTDGAGTLRGVMAALQVGTTVTLRGDHDLSGSLESTEASYTNETVVGSIARTGEGAVYHYGTDGFLVRCINPPTWTCGRVTLTPSDLSFRGAAVNANDDLFLLGRRSTTVSVTYYILALRGGQGGSSTGPWRGYVISSGTTMSPSPTALTADGELAIVGRPTLLSDKLMMWYLQPAP